MKKLFLSLAALLVLGALTAEAQFTITGYTGSGGNVVIPASTNGYPVTIIGDEAFYNQT